MGANISSAKQYNEQITDIVSTTINETIQKCSAASSSSQKIEIKGLTLEGCSLEISDLNQTIDSKIDLTCVLTTENKTKMTNDIQKKIDSAVENATKGINFGLNAQLNDTVNKIKEKIKNEIINKNVLDCSVNAANNQLIEISDLKVLNCPAIAPTVKISNLTQLLVTNAVAKCTGDIISDDDISNISKSEIKSESKNILEGLSGFELMGIIGGIIVLVVIGGGIYLFFKSGAATRMSPMYPPPPPPIYPPPPSTMYPPIPQGSMYGPRMY